LRLVRLQAERRAKRLFRFGIPIPIAANFGGSAGGYLENAPVVEQFRKGPPALLVVEQFRKGPPALLVPVQQSQHHGTGVLVQHADRDVEEFVGGRFA